IAVARVGWRIGAAPGGVRRVDRARVAWPGRAGLRARLGRRVLEGNEEGASCTEDEEGAGREPERGRHDAARAHATKSITADASLLAAPAEVRVADRIAILVDLALKLRLALRQADQLAGLIVVLATADEPLVALADDLSFLAAGVTLASAAGD